MRWDIQAGQFVSAVSAVSAVAAVAVLPSSKQILWSTRFSEAKISRRETTTRLRNTSFSNYLLGQAVYKKNDKVAVVPHGR